MLAPLQDGQEACSPPFRVVLVTGASGFVGSHVLNALLQQHIALEVRCLTRRPTPELLQLEASSAGRVKLCVGDLLGPHARSTLAAALAGCDGLIHCAAHYRWWSRRPETYDALNHTAVVTLMEAAKEAGVRKIAHVSTVLAMGSPPGWGSLQRPLRPDTPPGPTASRYAASKAAGDAAVLRMAGEADVETVPIAAAGEEAGAATAVPASTAAALPAVPEVQMEAAEAAENTEAEAATASAAAAAAPTVAMQPCSVATVTAAEHVRAAPEAVRERRPEAPPTTVAVALPGAEAEAKATAAGRGGLPACVVALACVVGADRRLVGGPEEDVMRIADLVRGKVAASLGHDTTFTYIGVRDAAAAIVAALLRGRPGRRYLVGNQRLSTAEYFDTIARLSGTPPPRWRVPVWVAAGWAAAAAGWAELTGVPPQAPPDLVRTVAYGTLLFDSSCSEQELRLELPYRDIRESFREAVQYIQEYDRGVRQKEAEAEAETQTALQGSGRQ